jgi:hypothetical protein
LGTAAAPEPVKSEAHQDPETTKSPHLQDFRDGRGGFRTCDLSRVKRDEGIEKQPPEQGRLF